tara:strand:+ start:280 stop:954 length:675 start_codon:yes stop_codon:yes gene_type:complete
MKVTLQSITPNAEENIVEIARVSSSRKDKKAKPEGLLNYLIKNKHFSPFEHGYLTLEIETSKAIGIQLIRHRSFTFQEFSQRYQDVSNMDTMFEYVEIRKQCEDNRQSSSEVFSPEWKESIWGGIHDGEDYTQNANAAIRDYLDAAKSLYNSLISVGVAREQARMILPMCTKTKIFMTGSIRSWIHFFEIRDDEHAQKEIRLIAKQGKEIFKEELPIISKALGY